MNDYGPTSDVSKFNSEVHPAGSTFRRPASACGDARRFPADWKDAVFALCRRETGCDERRTPPLQRAVSHSGWAAVTIVLNLLIGTSGYAVENVWDYSVQVGSTVQANPPQITLSWPQDSNGVPSSYTVSRKAPNASTWGGGITLSGSTTSYADPSVTAGTAYEYRVVKVAAGYRGYGYVQTGIDVPLVDRRGKVVLIVDDTFSTSLASELARLVGDLEGDGWIVMRHDVARSTSPAGVKALIVADYRADPANVKCVFLFGHVAVPYSGQVNPDLHMEHLGAWPADVYYGDVDGSWTDYTVNFRQDSNPSDAARLSNFPEDGKFDQTAIPSPVELAVGRVDLSRMPGRTTWGGPPTFPNETELHRKYLNKDHNFRHRISNPARRALIADYTGVRDGEAFGASGFRSFAPLVGAGNIRDLNREFNDQQGVWIPEATQNDYLFAFASGGGSYSSLSGIGSGPYHSADTVEFVSKNVRTVINLMYGSWLADWDTEDSILRAPLATDHGLVSVCSGRPHWFLHPLGLGETIGYAARLTQNNTGLYENQMNAWANSVHIALMGDPTLRLHPVAPVGSLSGSRSGSAVALTWLASPESNIIGYHVYRSTGNGPYDRLTASPVTALNYYDANAPTDGRFMVRAIKRENTTSGSYLNPSQGIHWPARNGSDGGGTTTAPSTPTSPSPTPSGMTLWFDDALPAGAGGGSTNGDGWNWISSNPAPVSGSKSHQTNVAAGLHEHFFNWGSSFMINAGESLVTYVFLDPANPPTEIMFSWAADNWEHRAYWGADRIDYGTRNSPGRYYAGPLPAAGQWVRLDVAASAVGLEGRAIQGMAFSTFDGRAAFDASGKAGGSTSMAPPPTPPPPPPATISPVDTIWFDDQLPAGAGTGSSGGDSWNWITSNPAPASGSRAHQSNLAAGLHEHAFNWAAPLSVGVAEKLFVYVYLDPAYAPTEIMLSWCTNSWEHRAYWGADRINYGTPNTAGRYYAGALPAAGQWVRLEVPASAVALAGQMIQGMCFSTFDGRVTYDATGRSSGGTTSSPSPPTSTGADFVWFDDAVPPGAGISAGGGDTWNWVSSSPAPISGTKSHQSSVGAGLHEHAFNWAGATMPVAGGDILYTYVYIDPANPTTEIMLSWGADNWEHRAYWGADRIGYGVNGTASRYRVGPLPPAGQWVRLEVPASAVGLEGLTVQAMGFSTFDGRVTYDKTGKASR